MWDLQRWSHIPISLAGKMYGILYIFFIFINVYQYTYVKKCSLHSLDKIISEFIWKALLQRPKSKGGMELLNFQIYYLVSNI